MQEMNWIQPSRPDYPSIKSSEVFPNKIPGLQCIVEIMHILATLQAHILLPLYGAAKRNQHEPVECFVIKSGYLAANRIDEKKKDENRQVYTDVY